MLFAILLSATAALVPQQHLGRRSVVLGAAGAAVTSSVGAAFATGAENDAALFDEEDHNEGGDASKYLPVCCVPQRLLLDYLPLSRFVLHSTPFSRPLLQSVKLETGGQANSKLSVVMPKVGPRTVDGDFVDCMWFKDKKNGKVIAASSFKSNGRTPEFSMRDDTGVEPSFTARINKGTTVIPMIHAVKGGTWEGAAYTLK